MTDFPFESNIHVKRKIEPAEGFSLWFADVPEGGLAADTYLCCGASDERSDFYVEPHYHPKSDEHFTILEGEVRFEIDGKERIVKEGDDCVIPRGAVHSIASPKGKNVKFKVKGDHDPVAERDFLIQMFTLVESNQFGLLKKYTCWYQSGNFVPKIGWGIPKIIGRILVLFLGGFLGTFLGLGKADLKRD